MCVGVRVEFRSSLGDRAWLTASLLEIFTITRNYSQIAPHFSSSTCAIRVVAREAFFHIKFLFLNGREPLIC